MSHRVAGTISLEIVARKHPGAINQTLYYVVLKIDTTGDEVELAGRAYPITERVDAEAKMARILATYRARGIA